MLLTLTTWLTPTRTPEELMLQYQETGKARFLKELVEQHYDDLLHFLISQSNPHLAADITQKTWLKVMEKRHYYQSHNKFKAWLFTIARRLLIDEFRKHNRLTELNETHLEATDNPTYEDSDIQSHFNAALLSLNFYLREAFILQQEGFSVSEIAQITNEEFETIKSRLRYAKKQLRTLLEGLSDE